MATSRLRKVGRHPIRGKVAQPCSKACLEHKAGAMLGVEADAHAQLLELLRQRDRRPSQGHWRCRAVQGMGLPGVGVLSGARQLGGYAIHDRLGIGGSMVGVDRLNVPAIDTFSH